MYLLSLYDVLRQEWVKRRINTDALMATLSEGCIRALFGMWPRHRGWFYNHRPPRRAQHQFAFKVVFGVSSPRHSLECRYSFQFVRTSWIRVSRLTLICVNANDKNQRKGEFERTKGLRACCTFILTVM